MNTLSDIFSHNDWTFDWSAVGIGPTVVFLLRDSLDEQAMTLLSRLARDFFMIRLKVSGADNTTFASALKAFFKERQLHRVHWIVVKDAADLAGNLPEKTVWSITVEGTKPSGTEINTVSALSPDVEPTLRQTFAAVDPPYRTSEHPI